ncbi:MAG: hypothetical protein ACE5R6_03670 [Candidatus Heimdallarchaeota archaeon]
MVEIPNFETFKELLGKLDQDFNILSRLSRYKTMAAESVSMGLSLGLTSEEDTSRALFVSDFIITASEVPSGGTDEERHQSVIQTFISGINQRGASSDALMRVYYLAYKLAIMIRRQDLFMAGRGLPRETALLRLMDTHITPYLAVCADLLGIGSCGWELGILTAALHRTYPHSEVQNLMGAPKNTDRAALVPIIWRILKTYAIKHPVDINNNIVITNIKNSKSIFVLDSEKKLMAGLWNCIQPNFSSKADREALTPLVNFLKKIDVERHLLYLRGRILGTVENFFFVRNPFLENKPFLVLRTTADEINVSEMLTILQLRGLDYKGWLEIRVDEGTPSKAPVLDQPEKEGLLAKIKRILGFKKSAKRKLAKPGVSKKRFFDSFLTHAITVDAVGDIKLFEMFDVERESEYTVEGALESDFERNQTCFLTEKKLGDPLEIATLLDGLDEVLEKAAKHFFGRETQFLPEEILFTTQDRKRHIITLAGNISEKRIVGTIASTYVQDIMGMQPKKEETLLKRRTLLRRTNQLLTTRRTTFETFEKSLERVYGVDLDQSATQSYTLDRPILRLE